MPDPTAHDLTFLFTDVEGSTLLLERLGPGYGIVLEKHRALITAAIEQILVSDTVHVDGFTDAVRRVAAGGTVLDVAILEVLRAGEPTARELAILELAATNV